MQISFANGRFVILVVALIVVVEAPRSVADGFPEFVRQGIAINPKLMVGHPLKYPHDDAIFPSIVPTGHLAGPLAKYYMYFGPHDPPGGIYLAYADSLIGPWKQYDADPATPILDPVISRNWTGNYRVSHVASPDAQWIPEENKLFLWFHGENTTTRFASSTDGLHFRYEGVAINTASFDGNLTDTSYARIRRTAMPARNAKYVMTLLGNENNTRSVYLAWSSDARNWHTQRDIFLSPPGSTTDKPNIACPKLLDWEGQKLIVYHRDSLLYRQPTADLWATPISNNLKVAGPPRLVFKSQDEDLNRIASPEFLADGDKLFMFYDSGHRLNNTICYATASIPVRHAESIDLRSCSSKASSEANGSLAANAIDANAHTSWSANSKANRWLHIDLQKNRLLSQLKIHWQYRNELDYAVYIATGANPPDPDSALNRWDMIAKVGASDDRRSDIEDNVAEHQFDFLRGSLTAAPKSRRATSSVVDNQTGLRARYVMVYITNTMEASIHEIDLSQLVDVKATK